MKPARFYILAILLFAVPLMASAFLWLPAAAQEKGKEKVVRPLVKWEYKFIHSFRSLDQGKLEEVFNKLGDDGWELVAIEAGHIPAPVTPARYVFKRMK